jgi:hypothetical protein
MNDEPWYGAKCIFLHADLKSEDGHLYEERIVLLKAESEDEAIDRAENEAKEYAQNLEGCSYLGYVNVFHVYDESIGDGTEVFSLMRTSKLSKKKYLDRFFDTGKERTRE